MLRLCSATLAIAIGGACQDGAGDLRGSASDADRDAADAAAEGEIAAADADADGPACDDEGAACAVDRVCHAGACVVGCWVDGRFVAPGPDPAAPCRVCAPLVTVTALEDAADGVACAGGVCAAGACFPGCRVEGALVVTGAAAPGDACRVCDPARDATGWSARGEGAACGPEHERCIDGVCRRGCLIDGVAVASSARDPAEPCRVCDPGRAEEAWSRVGDGGACDDSSVCVAGACTPGCWFGGVYHALGAASRFGPCEVCAEGHPTVPVARADGAPCPGGVCVAGGCSDGCVVDGQLYLPFEAAPDAACTWCDPATARTAFSARPDGAACEVGRVCVAGACDAACVVDGVVYAPGGTAVGQPCVACDPAAATAQLTAVADGAACGAGQVCKDGACLAGCFIEGVVYGAGVAAPGEPCRACRPERATDGWSARDDFTTCGVGAACLAGACVPQ